MAEHQIRLRGGWECRAAGLPESAGERLSLPIHWPPEAPRRLQLVRRFGRPPLDAEGHTLLLKLDHVPGIHRLLLNGNPLVHSSPGKTSYEITLDRVIERNILVLEIETPPPGDALAAPAPEWGFVSLLIRPIDSQSGCAAPSR